MASRRNDGFWAHVKWDFGQWLESLRHGATRLEWYRERVKRTGYRALARSLEEAQVLMEALGSVLHEARSFMEPYAMLERDPVVQQAYRTVTRLEQGAPPALADHYEVYQTERACARAWSLMARSWRPFRERDEDDPCE